MFLIQTELLANDSSKLHISLLNFCNINKNKNMN